MVYFLHEMVAKDWQSTSQDKDLLRTSCIAASDAGAVHSGGYNISKMDNIYMFLISFIIFPPCWGARADPNASLNAVSRTPTVPWKSEILKINSLSAITKHLSTKIIKMGKLVIFTLHCLVGLQLLHFRMGIRCKSFVPPWKKDMYTCNANFCMINWQII